MRKSLFCFGIILGVMVIGALPVSVSAEDGAAITQRDFGVMLFTAKQLDGRFPDAGTATDKIKILSDLGHAPEGGYAPQSNLTLGDFSHVMVSVLDYKKLLPENPVATDYIKVLAKDGIVKDADPGTEMTKADVITSFTAASLPVSPAAIPDFDQPLSPID